MTLGALFAIIGGGLLAGIGIDCLNADERKKELSKMTPEEIEQENKFWDRMMQ